MTFLIYIQLLVDPWILREKFGERARRVVMLRHQKIISRDAIHSKLLKVKGFLFKVVIKKNYLVKNPIEQPKNI